MAILDVHMPIMNGFELALELNAKKTDNKIPIIFLTSDSPAIEKLLQGYESGAVDYIIKSLNKNLSSLNNTFRLQQKSSEDFLKDQEACASESKKYREQMKKLNENLTALNQVYSNMLSAMDGRKN
ncbi:Cyclic di-GMP phosphodiesterase [bioreactor metagenome]|uniref:Cyclic di-GMP phosphodiesterase n=1 Tax=bioreactor metagenome TaxID=1076179 RepID=A0A644WRF9_9ZZZZ|nr:response regulator [Paludibacter sp.]